MADLDYEYNRPGYNNITTCIKSDNLDVIEQALTLVLEKEGCRLIPKPPLSQNPKPLIQELLSTSWKMDPYLWVIGLTVGNLGWSIIKTSIKTYPNDWLFLRIPSRERPRLSKLAMELKCDAFHYRVIRDDESLLLEANSRGNFQFNSTNNPQFSLIEVSESLHRAMQVNQDPEIVRKKAEYHAEFNRQKADGKINVQLLAAMLDLCFTHKSPKQDGKKDVKVSK